MRQESGDAGKFSLFITGLGGGGAERATLTLGGGIADRGHDVDLVVTRASGEFARDVPENVRLVDLEAARIATSLLPLVRYLRTVRPAAIVSMLTPTNCIAVWARILSGIDSRLVVVEQNTMSRSARHSRNRRGRYLPLLARWSHPRADQVIAVSSGVADDLARVLRYDRRRIEVVPNPVVSVKLLSQAREEVDHPWFSSSAPPVVLAAGRLTAQKDFPTLLRAFARLRRTRPARLVILGEGEERGRLEALAEVLGVTDSVAFPGFDRNPYRYMRRAAVFVLSSRWEGFGNVLVEAMACGTPVVSTDCPNGPGEILEDGRWGHLIPVGSPDRLADAIDDVLDGNGIPARERAIAFATDRVVDQYLSLVSSASS